MLAGMRGPGLLRGSHWWGLAKGDTCSAWKGRATARPMRHSHCCDRDVWMCVFLSLRQTLPPDRLGPVPPLSSQTARDK